MAIIDLSFSSDKWKMRFERERLARKEAENLLEQKSRDIYFANLELEKKNKEVNAAHEEIVHAFEELSSSQEELRQTMEELITTNEEMSRTQLELKKKNEILKENEDSLKQNTAELLATNEHLHEAQIELEDTIAELKDAQEAIIRSEKMASLGQLVAGVSHEINTPVGVAITAASHLNDSTTSLVSNLKSGTAGKADLVQYLTSAEEASKIILNNLERAAELIQSFKKVAVNQSVEQVIEFNLKDNVQDAMNSLKPELRKAAVNFQIHSDNNIIISSVPGAFAQIIMNFVTNALRYAFEPGAGGNIQIYITQNENEIELKFSDNGKGIPKDHLPKIFDPFFTTGRQKGGSGLGLHIVFNIITQKLNGEISCESEEGKGTTFIIKLPKNS